MGRRGEEALMGFGRNSDCLEPATCLRLWFRLHIMCPNLRTSRSLASVLAVLCNHFIYLPLVPASLPADRRIPPLTRPFSVTHSGPWSLCKRLRVSNIDPCKNRSHTPPQTQTHPPHQSVSPHRPLGSTQQISVGPVSPQHPSNRFPHLHEDCSPPGI